MKCIVQVSALGVDKGIETPYFQTRRAVEAYLNNTLRPELVEGQGDSIRFLILRPSLVYGSDGASSKLFTYLASLPLHLLTAGGKQRVQPVHIDEICEA